METFFENFTTLPRAINLLPIAEPGHVLWSVCFVLIYPHTNFLELVTRKAKFFICRLGDFFFFFLIYGAEISYRENSKCFCVTLFGNYRNDLGHIVLSHLCTGFDLKSIRQKHHAKNACVCKEQSRIPFVASHFKADYFRD